jgi:hypothetical protein
MLRSRRRCGKECRALFREELDPAAGHGLSHQGWMGIDGLHVDRSAVGWLVCRQPRSGDRPCHRELS